MGQILFALCLLIVPLWVNHKYEENESNTDNNKNNNQ